MRTAELFKFIRERHAIWERRKEGLPKPWTKDPILRSYRFCNVYRDLDKETIWFAKNWGLPHQNCPDLWFASLVFRFINLGESAAAVGFPVPWKPEVFVKQLKKRQAAGLKTFSSAYMISTHGVREGKVTYLAKSLSKIWRKRESLRMTSADTFDAFHGRLMNCFDVGSFMAGQVIADIKYAQPYLGVEDWHTFAASGPGSRRGLNRVYGMAHDLRQSEEAWRRAHAELKFEIDKKILKAGMPALHAQDLQNCLCEFDKYERVRLGEGRPKQRYNGERD